MGIKFIIEGEPRPKKNKPRIIWKKSEKPFEIKFGKYVVMRIPYRPMIISSKGYEEFSNEVLCQLASVKKQMGVINYPVNVEALYYRSTKHKVDLSNLNEALHDAMVESGLLLDDNRDIVAGHDGSRVFYDKYNPRIEITITELKDYEQWNNTKDEQRRLF